MKPENEFLIRTPLLSDDCSHIFVRLVKPSSTEVVYVNKKLGSDSMSYQCEGFVSKDEEKRAIDYLERLRPIDWSNFVFTAIEHSSYELVDMIQPARIVGKHLNYPFIFHKVGKNENTDQYVYEWIVSKVDINNYRNSDFMEFCDILGVSKEQIDDEETVIKELTVIDAIQNIAEYMEEEERDYIENPGKHHIWLSLLHIHKELGV